MNLCFLSTCFVMQNTRFLLFSEVNIKSNQMHQYNNVTALYITYINSFPSNTKTEVTLTRTIASISSLSINSCHVEYIDILICHATFILNYDIKFNFIMSAPLWKSCNKVVLGYIY